MAKQRLYKLLFSICILVCLISLVEKVSLVLPFLPQLWIWENLENHVNPMLTSPLSEYEYVIWDNTKQDELLGERLYQTHHHFVKACPSINISYLRYYYTLQGFTDSRIKIKYLILAHFHGSRYKDVISLS